LLAPRKNAGYSLLGEMAVEMAKEKKEYILPESMD
jgi:hypothetical protein